MNDLVLPAAPVVSVPVAGDTRRFPVRRVYCVGRNYAEHAREMGFSDREPPFFFCKPPDAVAPVREGHVRIVEYPARTSDYQHEVELVAAIGKGGRDIDASDALDHVWGYAIGLDMTRRDAQISMREMGRPWEIGKAFDASALIGELRPVASVGHVNAGRIWLDVDGARRQDSDVSRLIWSVAETLSHLSTWFELEAGDLVYTGTPAGVGPVRPGQTMVGGIDGLGELRVRIAPPRQQRAPIPL
ncbi:MAG TPA: fumarylacetoacetate hydrolase family protein [Ramlibacter sp.]|nr:fumarylacetoacetate hydrolase family protein [Ramlibacter sp.]